MNVTYFKRFRMEMNLFDAPEVPVLPAGFYWVAWDESLIELHAEVKYAAFQEEIDAAVFPSLGDRQGCSFLMTEICRRPGFVPESTWLVGHSQGYCGTVQGLRERTGVGAIQNLGVVPAYRDLGIGRALLLQALHGFRRAGLGKSLLEVTAQNDAAVRLYRRVGFRCCKTVYRAVDAIPVS